MTVREKLAALREKMTAYKMDIYHNPVRKIFHEVRICR